MDKTLYLSKLKSYLKVLDKFDYSPKLQEVEAKYDKLINKGFSSPLVLAFHLISESLQIRINEQKLRTINSIKSVLITPLSFLSLSINLALNLVMVILLLLINLALVFGYLFILVTGIFAFIASIVILVQSILLLFKHVPTGLEYVGIGFMILGVATLGVILVSLLARVIFYYEAKLLYLIKKQLAKRGKDYEKNNK